MVLEDGSGNEIARWELVGSEASSPAIADLTEGWEGYVQRDRRSDEPAVDRDFAEALAAIHRFEWDRAVVALGRSEQAHPQHPLIQLLTAWCRNHQPDFPRRDEIPAMLRRVAASQAAGLTRFIDQGNFPGLEPGPLYDILAQQPESTRTAADLDRLAEAAMEAGRFEQALAHTEAALALEAADGRQFDRLRQRVELLLRLNRSKAATEWLDVWSTEKTRSSEDLAAMAEVLARFNQSAGADKLFTAALGQENLKPERRYDLLVRLANTQRGTARWQALLRAAALKPDDSAARRQCLDALLAELNEATVHAEVAGKLADGAEEPEIKFQLRLRQAELTAEPAAVSEILWGIYQSGRLPDQRLAWACRHWNQANQPKQVIEAVEARLHSGGPLPDDVRIELEAAYRRIGRLADARRAATTDGAE